MEKKFYFEDDGTEATIYIDESESVISFRIDRLIAFQYIMSCNDYDAYKKIDFIKDRKGTLSVFWNQMPTIKMLLSVKNTWEMLNECAIENYYNGKLLIQY
jgi:hypothetical protein